MKLIFKNVTVVNADGMLVQDVFVEDGKIVGPFEDVSARRFDGTGLHLIPGVIDAHVHFREPGASHKEDWESGSRAAAMGGVTTVLDMPNTDPPTTSLAALEAKRELVAGRSYVNYGFHFGATGENFSDLQAASGIAGIKVYMGSSIGDLLVDNPEAWEQIFMIAKGKDVPVIVHAEDEKRIRERKKEFEGQDDPAVYAKIRDCECAKIAVEEAIAMRKRISNKLHIAHMSCREELQLVKKSKHPDLTCEVAPHHLFFTMDAMQDAFLKMNPPLRTQEDLIALWEGVRAGLVTCIATDHAPHTIDEKQRPIMDAPAGVPGVEFVLPLMLNEVNLNMLTFDQLVQLLSAGPAGIFGLRGKGAIREGMDADFVLVDMEKEHTITRAMVQSKCGWSPYEGYKLKGWPVMTVVNGEIVMEEGEIVGGLRGEEVL